MVVRAMPILSRIASAVSCAHFCIVLVDASAYLDDLALSDQSAFVQAKHAVQCAMILSGIVRKGVTMADVAPSGRSVAPQRLSQ